MLKARAKRYIAAGKDEWLYPETLSVEPWSDLRSVFLPPDSGLWQFGGEMYTRFESGEVRYQDAFGRTEKEREFLKKKPPSKPLHARDLCGCGSGRAFGACCERKSVAFRPTWDVRSIRERNIALFTGISEIVGLAEDRDWVTVRRDLTDEKIRDVYSLFYRVARRPNLLYGVSDDENGLGGTSVWKVNVDGGPAAVWLRGVTRLQSRNQAGPEVC